MTAFAFVICAMVMDNGISFYLTNLVYRFNRNNKKELVSDSHKALILQNFYLCAFDWIAFAVYFARIFLVPVTQDDLFIDICMMVVCIHTSQRIISLQRIKRLAFLGKPIKQPVQVPLELVQPVDSKVATQKLSNDSDTVAISTTLRN
jgi:hypothetical protein